MGYAVSVFTDTFGTRTPSCVLRSVISVPLGITKLDIVLHVTQVTAAQSRECAAQLQSLVATHKIVHVIATVKLLTTKESVSSVTKVTNSTLIKYASPASQLRHP